MVVAELQTDLDEMGLTKKQMKVLHDRIAKLQLHVNQGSK
jgi:ribosomal protein S15P/S13E